MLPSILGCVERIDACLLAQGDVMAEHRIVNFDVQRTGPSRVSQDRSELVLIMRLGHEDMGAPKTAAHRSGEFHNGALSTSLMSMRS